MNSFFGIGIMELFFIAILAMIVLGPERLPGLIREGAKWMRQIRRLTSDLTSQFSEEMKALDEINPQRIMRELTDPEQDEAAKKPPPAAKPAAATAAKSATKPAPAKSTTPAKPAAPKATANKVTAAAATSAAASAPQDGQPPAADVAPAASVATAPVAPGNDASLPDAWSSDGENRILPPPAAEASAPAEQTVVSGAAGAASKPAAPKSAPPKSTIGDPRPLMARNAAQKAEKNGAPSVPAVNGDEGLAKPPHGSSAAAPAAGEVAAPVSDVAPDVPSAAADGKAQSPEGDA